MNIDYFRFNDGDLQNLMGVHGLIPEKVPRVLLKQAGACKIAKVDSKGEVISVESSHPEHVAYITELKKTGLPRAVCLRDSFMTPMAPLLSAHFSRLAYYWQQNFPQDVIEREHPDIVIEEIVERDLVRYDPQNPPDVDLARKNQYLAGLIDKL
jgi:hypothetical protein